MLRTQVIAGIGHLHTLAFAFECASLDAEQRIVGVEIAVEHVMHIICCQQRNFRIIPVLDQPLIENLDLRNIVLLQFEEKVILTKNVLIPANGLFRFFLAPIGDHARDFSR